MPAKTIDEIVNDTITNLKSKLLKRKRPTADEAIQILKVSLDAAFAQVNEENQNNLYKKLSLQFHADKLRRAQPDLHAYLVSVDLIDAPQKMLNERKPQPANVFNEIASDPLSGTKKAARNFYNKFKPMFFEYKRYIQPFRFLANLTSWLINIALILSAIALFIPVTLIVLTAVIVKSLNSFLINTITNKQYTQEIENYTIGDEVKFAKAKELYLLLQQQKLIFKNAHKPEVVEQFKNLNAEEIMKLVKEETRNQLINKGVMLSELSQEEQDIYIEKQIKKDILSIIQVTPAQSFVLHARAFYHAITKPLPQGFFNKLASIVARPLRILAAPIFLTVSALSLVINYVNVALILLNLAVPALLKFATLLLLNAPLYALDAVRSIRKFVSHRSEEPRAEDSKEESAEESEEEEIAQQHFDSNILMIEQMPPSRAEPEQAQSRLSNQWQAISSKPATMFSNNCFFGKHRQIGNIEVGAARLSMEV